MNNTTPNLAERLSNGRNLATGDVISLKGKGFDHAGAVRVTRAEPKSREKTDGDVEEDVLICVAKSYRGQVIPTDYVFALEVDLRLLQTAAVTAEQQALQVRILSSFATSEPRN